MRVEHFAVGEKSTTAKERGNEEDEAEEMLEKKAMNEDRDERDEREGAKLEWVRV